jgi:DNA-binding beta-propeller fold protein YncE
MTKPLFRARVLGVVALCGFGGLLAGCVNSEVAPGFGATAERVGRTADPKRTVTPVNQVLTPLGRIVELPGLRPQGLALSPDGRSLIVSGKTSELVVVDPVAGTIRQRVALPGEGQAEPQPGVVSPNILEPDKKGQLSYTGLIFSRDGRKIFLSNVNGSIKVFAVGDDGAVRPSHSFPLPLANAPRRKEEIPSGLALSADGARLYVCANLSNQLLELDAVTGRVVRTFPVGVAPYDVVLVGGKAYVSNWGGRRPGEGDHTGPAGRGTVVRVTTDTHIANEGSVSVVPLAASGGEGAKEILTGLHASALAVSPNGHYVVCANAAADNLSVIDTRSDAVVETIWVKPKPSELLGASPNALVFEPSGRRLYVANGTQNAVAVVRFDPADRESKLEGLIPVGWFPAALVYDAARQSIYAANLKGLPEVKQKMSGRHGDGFYVEAIFRFALARGGAGGGGFTQAFGDGVAQPPARGARAIAVAGTARSTSARDSRAQRRAEPHQARRLYHQRKSHLRSGLRRAEGRQRRSFALHLRRGDHAQSAQARARFRAAR